MEEMGIHDELVENGKTIEENSELKARQLRNLFARSECSRYGG